MNSYKGESNFGRLVHVVAALTGLDKEEIRSWDVEALTKVKNIDFDYPINIGNDSEISLNKLKDLMKNKFGNLDVKFLDSVIDDPRIRRPDISKAKKILNWKPKIELERGIDLTYNYFKKLL